MRLAVNAALQRDFLRQQDGFIRRELLKGHGNQWIDLVYWASQAAAEGAMQNAAQSPVCSSYFALMLAASAAALAPSGANQQSWTFVVVSDPQLKREMRLAAEAEERESYTRRMSQEWLDALAPLGTDWHKPHIEQAPYVLVVFEQPYGLTEAADGTEQRVKYYYVKESVGIAVGILLASLTHAGLATLTHTPSPMAFLTTLLGRPANERPYVLIPIGYPAEGTTVPAITKKPLAQVLIHFAPEDTSSRPQIDD